MRGGHWLLVLGGLGVLGCFRTSGSQEISIQHDQALFVDDSRLLLIDERSTTTATIEPLAIAYDARTGRESWRAAVPSEYIDASENGRFGVALTPRGDFSVDMRALDLEHGTRRKLEARSADPSRQYAHRECTAMSNDGNLIAGVLDGQLSVWEASTGRLLQQQAFGSDERADEVRFLDDGHDLLVEVSVRPNFDDHRTSVLVLARQADSWQLEQRMDEVRGYGWTARGLLFGSPRGVERYDRHQRTLLVAGLHLNSARFSEDGRYVAYRVHGDTLNVYDFDKKRVALTSTWQRNLRFHGTSLTAMTHGKLWRGNLTDGKSKVVRDFGPPSTPYKIPFFGGESTNTHYEFILGPHGTYLYYVEPGQTRESRTFLVDQL